MEKSKIVRLGSRDGSGDGWGGTLPLRHWPGTREIVVDATNLRFAVPVFLLRLQSFTDWHRAQGMEVTLFPPADPGGAAYLARMHLDPETHPGPRTLPTVRERERGDVLIPITRLHELPDVDALNDDLAPLLQAHFDDVAALAGPMHMAISELCGNGVEHGSSDYGRYLAAQRYERAGAETG